ncbi:hypothetical protein GLX30_30535 [Streptomyces sp. Tu 2975]|uniref:hypothetical protein n=1 Tax=Streptomyces sp. Tu 2975 TaxID=2676871 RepID=UPI00135AF321|nr:hypothetical protein [Streptomyces sp. Tu 2975]QIP87650.1 hypothetical protein GLX30_30535 [Streptomyces sp. Tu 2975]
MNTEETAYQRLQRVAAKASRDAGLLALQTVRAIHWECAALDEELAGKDTAETEAARDVMRRIRVHLAKCVDQPQ